MKTRTINFILSRIGTETIDHHLRFVSLNTSLFSNDFYKNKLVFTQDDIEGYYGIQYPEFPMKVNDKLNNLANILYNQNITLLFIPGINNYNTHYDYILNPLVDKNPFYEIMDGLNKSYFFVDTKQIAITELSKGKKDLHGIGDLHHWTYVLAGAVADNINLSLINPDHQIQFNQSKEFQKAIYIYRSVINYENSSDPWTLSNNARLFKIEGDIEKSLSLYKRSLNINPNQTQALYEMMEIYTNDLNDSINSSKIHNLITDIDPSERLRKHPDSMILSIPD